MPWPEACSMDARMKFIAAVLADEDTMTALCEEFGISRRVGYKWLARYKSAGAAGLLERSRAPQTVRWAISQAAAAAITGLRRQHPSWGPKKLRAKLTASAPHQPWPAVSTIGDLLRREGLSARRRRRRQATPSPSGIPPIVAPNAVWCVDFKGWFRTGDGARCDPLTVTDGFSRFILCLRVTSPDYAGSRPAFERLFEERGLPWALVSDNGPPFASVAAGGLSRLSVWWIKLGINPVRIAPAKPQQNGRHERMHRTLKAETARPPAANLAAQQVRFDHFLAEFNHERPHEALGQVVPAVVYTPSPRPYPARLEEPSYPAEFELRRVRSNGEIKWQGQLIFISGPLIGEVIGLRETDDGNAEAYFGPVHLGTIDGATLKFSPVRPARPPRRSSVLPREQSWMKLKSLGQIASVPARRQGFACRARRLAPPLTAAITPAETAVSSCLTQLLRSSTTPTPTRKSPKTEEQLPFTKRGKVLPMLPD
jgi:putative transposase